MDVVALACARQRPGLSDDLACSGMAGIGLQVPRNVPARTEGAARTFTTSDGR